jgi:hypothetical protein
MANYAPSTQARIADLVYGMKVETGDVLGPALSTANPTKLTLFNVVGGRVLVTQFIAEATETFVGVGALIKFAFTPTGGVQVDLTAVSLDAGSGAWAAGIRLILGAAIGGSTTFSAVGASVAKAADPYVLGDVSGTGGALLSHATTAAFTDGTARFSLWYIPLDAGAYVTAAV